jgi:hypothetical protein
MFYLEKYQLHLYRHHLPLLAMREESAKARFHLLLHDLKPVSSSLRGYGDMLRQTMQQAQFVTPELVDFHANMQSLSTTLQEVDQQTRSDWQSLSEEEAQANLALYWDRRDAIDAMFALEKQSSVVEGEIDRLLNQKISLTQMLERNANLLWALYDVLINPSKMDIPETIVQREWLIRDAQTKAKEGNLEGLETLIDASVSPSEYFRQIAAETLQYFKDTRAVAMLMNLLFDEQEYIRGVAAHSLKQLKDTQAVPLLISALDQKFKDGHELGMIAEALGAMRDERAVDPLIDVLEKLMRRSRGLGDRQAQPLAGIYNALKAIGGDRANAAIERHFRFVTK